MAARSSFRGWLAGIGKEIVSAGRLRGKMSLAAAIARIDEIQSSFAPRDLPPVSTTNGGAAAPTAPTAVAATASSANPFSNVLNGALSNTSLAVPISGPGGFVNATAPVASNGGAPAGAQAMVALAQGEVGQAEFPPGSNDSPRIATYREATAGSGVGPWCAYFTSWLGQQAGVPLGDSGQGFGRVDDVYAWAQRVGRAVPNGPGVGAQPRRPDRLGRAHRHGRAGAARRSHPDDRGQLVRPGQTQRARAGLSARVRANELSGRRRIALSMLAPRTSRRPRPDPRRTRRRDRGPPRRHLARRRRRRTRPCARGCRCCCASRASTSSPPPRPATAARR